MTKEQILSTIRLDWYDINDDQDRIDVLTMMQILGEGVETALLEEIFSEWERGEIPRRH